MAIIGQDERIDDPSQAVSMSSGKERGFIALTLEVYYSDISILLIGMIPV